MKSKHPISRLALLIITSAMLGLTAHTQTDTIVLRLKQFDSMVQDIEINSSQNAAFRQGFDSLKTWYNDLAVKYEQSQRNLASCMVERDIAHKYIDTLRTNLSKAWTAKDHAVAQAEAERNKKNRDWSIGVMPVGYDFIGRRITFLQAGLIWSPNFLHFSLRGLLSSNQPAEQHANTLTDKLR